MYCIVFNGSVLSGHDPARVRAAVGERLRLGAVDIERLFSGQRTILKKGVPESTARRYIAILRELGMHAMLSPMQDSAQLASVPERNLKVVFWGQILPGFTQAGVMHTAERRLRLPLGQVERIFSGAKVVLKRGLDSGLAVRYRSELAQIGMRVELESDLPQSDAGAFAAMRAAQDEAAFSQLLNTQFELPARSFDAEEPLAPAPTAPPPPRRPVAAKAREAWPPAGVRERVGCPHCGHRQNPGRRCVACGGVIESSAREPSSAPATWNHGEAAMPKAVGRNRPGWRILILLIGVLGALSFWRLH